VRIWVFLPDERQVTRSDGDLCREGDPDTRDNGPPDLRPVEGKDVVRDEPRRRHVGRDLHGRGERCQPDQRPDGFAGFPVAPRAKECIDDAPGLLEETTPRNGVLRAPDRGALDRAVRERLELAGAFRCPALPVEVEGCDLHVLEVAGGDKAVTPVVALSAEDEDRPALERPDEPCKCIPRSLHQLE